VATNSLTPTPYLPTLTLSPTLSPTPEVVTKQCFTSVPSLPDTVIPPGILVIASIEGLSLTNFTTHAQKDIPGRVQYVGVSPDGKWLVYSKDISDVRHLTFDPVSGDESIRITLGYSINSTAPLQWLDNQRVWFSVVTLGSRVDSVMVLNPFTRQIVTISTDYPNVSNYQAGVGGTGLQFGYSAAFYDPSLNLVIYPEYDPEGPTFLTLWDRISKKRLARIYSWDVYNHLPIWQANQGEFLAVGLPALKSKYEEWFTVKPDGQIHQISDFEKGGKRYIFNNNASLSPDGKTLAFGLSFLDEATGYYLPGSLILFDLATLQAMDTCLPISKWSRPAWSLDGRYFAIATQPDNENHNRLFLVDTKEKQSYFLLEGNPVYPHGWLVQP
jgi:hypothetical protein